MLSSFFKKRKASPGKMIPKTSAASAAPSSPPFGKKDKSEEDVLNVLIRSSGYNDFNSGRDKNELKHVMEAIQKDFGNNAGSKAGEKSKIVTKFIHREIDATTMTLPGYQLVAMPPRMHFSRMRNLEADKWEFQAYKDADAFVYSVHVTKSEEYLATKGHSYSPGWERDLFEISRLLRMPSVVENPGKPLLLLVNVEDEADEELDTERLVNLFGLNGYCNEFRRPFRAVMFSTNGGDAANVGALKESLEWLAKEARSSEEDETTAMAGSDTEEENSVGTSSTSGTFSSSVVDGGGHYVLDYEPTLLGGNATLQRFEPIKQGTHCPFAKSAKLWGGKPLREFTPRLAGRVDRVQEVVSMNAGPLAEFVARSNKGERLDGFCLEIPGGAYIGAEALGNVVRDLLTKLADLDPTPGENAMKKMGPINHPQWRFRFAGEDFFLTTFSNAYGKESSRHSFGVHKAFILFQPMTSFGRHGLTEDTPASATNWDNPKTMRDKARVAFKANGCPYHIPEELPYPVAEHVVKPKVDDGSTVVRWWEPATEKTQKQPPKMRTRGWSRLD